MEQVGEFLDTLLDCGSNSPENIVFRSPRGHHNSITAYSSQTLYSCPDFSQLDLQSLIIHIFSKIPKAYQILRCQASTTEEELSLFLQRTEKHCMEYLLLNVDQLPFKLQEVSYCFVHMQ